MAGCAHVLEHHLKYGAHALVLMVMSGRKEARNIAGSVMHPWVVVLAKWRVEWTSVNTGSKSGAVSGAGPFGV